MPNPYPFRRMETLVSTWWKMHNCYQGAVSGVSRKRKSCGSWCDGQVYFKTSTFFAPNAWPRSCPFFYPWGVTCLQGYSPKECIVGWQVEVLSRGGGLSMLECALFEGWVFWWRLNSTWGCHWDEIKGQVITRYVALNDRAMYIGAWWERVGEEDVGITEWVDMSDSLALMLCSNWIRAIVILTLGYDK